MPDHAQNPCPSWCVTDHSLEFSSAHVGRSHQAGYAWASAVRTADGAGVCISAHRDGAWPFASVSVRDAVELSAVIGMAGDPGELAGAIRAAAAEIEAEPEAGA